MSMIEEISRPFRSILAVLWFLLTEVLRAVALRIPTTGKKVAHESYRTVRNVVIAGVVILTIACLLLGANQIADRAAPILSEKYRSYRQPSVTRQLERKLELKKRYQESQAALRQQWAETPSAAENLWTAIQRVAD